MSLPKTPLVLDEIVLKYKNFLSSTGYAVPTVKNYLSDLKLFFAWFEKISDGKFDFYALSEANLLHYSRYLKYEFRAKPTISSRRISSLRTFLSWAKSEGLVSIEKTRSLSPVLREDEEPTVISAFRNYLKKSGYSAITTKNYLTDLRHLVAHINQNYEKFALSALNETRLRSYRTYLKEKYRAKPSIAARRLSSLRKFLFWANRNGLVAEDLLQAIEAPLKETPASPLHVINLEPPTTKALPPGRIVVDTPFPTAPLLQPAATTNLGGVLPNRLYQKLFYN